MSVQLQIEKMPGYRAARVTGAGVIEEVWQEFELIAEHCERANNNKLLIDLTGAPSALKKLDRGQKERLRKETPGSNAGAGNQVGQSALAEGAGDQKSAAADVSAKPTTKPKRKALKKAAKKKGARAK